MRNALRTLFNLIASLGFTALITAPGVAMLVRSDTHEATTENRALAERPDWCLSRGVREIFR
jgi:hypothetical protein